MSAVPAPMAAPAGARPLRAVMAGSLVALAVVLAEPATGWSGVLTAAVFGISLALGGAVFVAIQVVTGARWWLSFREVPFRLAGGLGAPVAALALALTLGLTTLYPWARLGAEEAAALLGDKRVWLNPPLFLARALLVVLVWWGFVAALRSRLDGCDPRAPGWARARLVAASVGFLATLAVTLSVAAWDWTMSLEPEWFSTIYTVYVFAGTLVAGVAGVTVLAMAGPEPVSSDQRHDLGKLLFAFSTFWAYIWFCQYMLVWYSNLPEETGHYVTRFAGGWSLLFWLNPILNFVVPFVVLLGAAGKRHPSVLRQVALVVLAGRWLDAHLLVAPPAGPAQAVPLGALAATLAVLGGMHVLVRRPLSAVVQDTE